MLPRGLKTGFFLLFPQDYPKLSQSYYSLLEVLTQDHMNFIASLEPHVIMYILSSISEGLTALGNSCCSPGGFRDSGWKWEEISVLFEVKRQTGRAAGGVSPLVKLEFWGGRGWSSDPSADPFQT